MHCVMESLEHCYALSPIAMHHLGSKASWPTYRCEPLTATQPGLAATAGADTTAPTTSQDSNANGSAATLSWLTYIA